MIEITDEMVEMYLSALYPSWRYFDGDLKAHRRSNAAGDLRAAITAVAPLIAAAEREACARVADTYQAEADTAMMNPYGDECWYEFKHGKAAAARDIADDIRARGASCA